MTDEGSAPKTEGAGQPRLPDQTELIIGLVGPVGINLGDVYASLSRVLTGFHYETVELHLSAQLHDLDWDAPLPDKPEDERIWAYMDAGNRLREEWDDDRAFALLAVNAVTRARRAFTGSDEVAADRKAYVLRSLKRPEEAELLRSVYGDRFILLSLYAPADVRQARLERRITTSRAHPTPTTPRFAASELVKRDAAESGAHGQGVRKVFHAGDFFVDVAENDLDADLRRIFEILFGHPHRTPSRDEQGMFLAAAAARRSAELGRQVGAALCTPEGSLLAIGTNDVPKAGGGLYWEDDTDDKREFQLGADTSDLRKGEIAKEIVAEIERRGLVTDHDVLGKIADLVASSKIDDLIEYVRAVHAEMAAIIDAAHRGVEVVGSTLFVTTFPCHHCARHVVAAGVGRVVYVAPYPKSLAEDLHGDALIVDPGPGDEQRDRVVFEPFVGVGPRRYLDLFEMPQRKNRDTGAVLQFDPRSALPRLSDIEPAELVPEKLGYVRREVRALELMFRVMGARGPRFADPPEPDPPSDDSSQRASA